MLGEEIVKYYCYLSMYKYSISMKPKVLIVHDWFSASNSTEENGIVFDRRGIIEITKWYSAVIINCWEYASIGKESGNTWNHIVSTDMQKIINATKEKLQLLRPEWADDIPIISLSEDSCFYTKQFLVRRYLSDNADNNVIRIVRVTATGRVWDRAKEIMAKYNKIYPNIEFDILSKQDFLNTDKLYDKIYLPKDSHQDFVIPDRLVSNDYLIGEYEDITEEKKYHFSREPEWKDEENKHPDIKTLLEVAKEKWGLWCLCISDAGYDMRCDNVHHMYHSVSMPWLNISEAFNKYDWV